MFFSLFWACDLILKNMVSAAAHREHTMIQSQAMQLIPVHDIQNLQCQSSATFRPLFLAEEEQEKLPFCQGYMSWFCSPCMASQLLRSCRHRRSIGYASLWQQKAFRGESGPVDLRLTVKLRNPFSHARGSYGQNITIERPTIKQTPEEMAHKWAE